jgi:hypothetical protein
VSAKVRRQSRFQVLDHLVVNEQLGCDHVCHLCCLFTGKRVTVFVLFVYVKEIIECADKTDRSVNCDTEDDHLSMSCDPCYLA